AGGPPRGGRPVPEKDQARREQLRLAAVGGRRLDRRARWRARSMSNATDRHFAERLVQKFESYWRRQGYRHSGHCLRRGRWRAAALRPERACAATAEGEVVSTALVPLDTLAGEIGAAWTRHDTYGTTVGLRQTKERGRGGCAYPRDQSGGGKVRRVMVPKTKLPRCVWLPPPCLRASRGKESVA